MSFEVAEGEVLSLIGPNGAGKTSAFNAITGYIPATTGEIVYRGTRLNGLPQQTAWRISALCAPSKRQRSLQPKLHATMF